MMRLSIALIGLAALAGCGPAPQTTSQEVQHGAATPPSEGGGTATPAGVGNINSDNKPTIARSGLNSDPNNPSGMPGRPAL